jgi:hypothetical protein
MFIRADFDRYEYVPGSEQNWVNSPQAGVERILLDRAGDEVAVATSFVRYAPGSHFPQHGHALGEEFIVVEGEFGDEHDRYPAGTYVRNPPGTAHVPFSDPGCVIWVKLRQFSEDDSDQRVSRIDMSSPHTGWQTQSLFDDGKEKVDVIRAAGNTPVRLSADYYCREMLVLKGSVDWQVEVTHHLGERSWIRVPPGCPLRVVTRDPCVLFTKTRPHSNSEAQAARREGQA